MFCWWVWIIFVFLCLLIFIVVGCVYECVGKIIFLKILGGKYMVDFDMVWVLGWLVFYDIVLILSGVLVYFGGEVVIFSDFYFGKNYIVVWLSF